MVRNELYNPALAGVVMNCRDLRERRSAEQALRLSEQRFRELVEHAADSFFLHDDEGRLLDVNRHACESLGYSRDELMAMRVQDFEMNFADGSVDGIWANMETGVPVTVHGRHRRKDGSVFPVEVRVGLFRSHETRRMVALARDVSDRVRVEAELAAARDRAETADRTKSVFLANVSHEIRTPVTAVMSMAQLLEGPVDETERQHYLEVIRGSCDSLLSVIDGLLDIAKIESGTLSIERNEFNLHGVIEGVLDMLAATAHRKGLELVALVREEVPVTLLGDAARLRQVLVNLVGNAVKFTDHGEVAIDVSLETADRDDVTLRFEVSDTGIGLPAEQSVNTLFDPFVRGAVPASHRHPGTGLGLAICKFIIDHMQGRIGGQRNEHGGSTFWFSVSLGRGTHEATPLTAAPGTRLLVIDGNLRVREALVAYASQAGMHAAAAGDANHATQLLRQAVSDARPVELALVDWRLGGADGLSLLQSLRSDEALGCPNVALLFPLGARVDPVVEQVLGSYSHIAKPVRQSRFPQLVASMLDRDHLSRNRSRARTEPMLLAPHRSAASTGREAAGNPGTTAAARGGNWRVLLAEDNPLNREGLSLLLQRMGCEVRAVADGREAVDAVARESFDVVFLDCQMPIMDGFQATAEIRSGETDGKHLAIVALTANAFASMRDACLAAGMDDYLCKPVTREQLLAALHRWAPRPTTSAAGTKFVEIPAAVRLRLQQMFVVDAAERLDEMDSARDDGDLADLGRSAHLLAGSAAQVGASDLLVVCREIERACADRQSAGLAELLAHAADAFNDAREAIEAPPAPAPKPDGDGHATA